MVAKVEFEVLAGLYTELLNNLNENDIIIDNIKKTDLGFIATINAKEYKKIARLSRKYGCKTKILEKKGLYFKYKEYIQRKGIFIGVILFFVLINIFNSMIWRIEVDTYDEDIVSDVLRILYENDIYVGTFYDKEKFNTATEEIFIKNEEIGNIALNFYKGVLVCDVDERDKKEDYLQDEKQNYILSYMDGTIKDLRVYSGFCNLKVGDTVARGDILVFSSSAFLPLPEKVYIPEDFVFPLVHQRPRAYITATTNKTYQSTILLNKEVLVLTGERDTEIFLKFLDFNFNIDKVKLDNENSVATQKIYSLDVFGFSLPFTINEITYYKRELTTLSYEKEDLNDIALNQINSVIKQDERLINVIDATYDLIINDNEIIIICEVFGEYEITI